MITSDGGSWSPVAFDVNCDVDEYQLIRPSFRLCGHGVGSVSNPIHITQNQLPQYHMS